MVVGRAGTRGVRELCVEPDAERDSPAGLHLEREFVARLVRGATGTSGSSSSDVDIVKRVPLDLRGRCVVVDGCVRILGRELDQGHRRGRIVVDKADLEREDVVAGLAPLVDDNLAKLEAAVEIAKRFKVLITA